MSVTKKMCIVDGEEDPIATCVIQDGNRKACIYAQDIKDESECKYWAYPDPADSADQLELENAALRARAERAERERDEAVALLRGENEVMRALLKRVRDKGDVGDDEINAVLQPNHALDREG